MMKIPADVERFIDEMFDSEESLTLVLALRSDAGREWSSRELLDHLVAHSGLVLPSDVPLMEKRFEIRLRDLEAKGLVKVSGDRKEPRFRYGAADGDAQDRCVVRVAGIYAIEPAGVSRIIYGMASRARTLAESFRL